MSTKGCSGLHESRGYHLLVFGKSKFSRQILVPTFPEPASFDEDKYVNISN
jgi:hypothetical protein